MGGTAVAHCLDVQRESLAEGWGEGDDAACRLSLRDPDAAGVEADVVEADGDEFGDSDAGLEQGLDQHGVTNSNLPTPTPATGRPNANPTDSHKK